MHANRLYGQFHISSPIYSRYSQSKNCQGLRKGARRWRISKARVIRAKLKVLTNKIIKETYEN